VYEDLALFTFYRFTHYTNLPQSLLPMYLFGAVEQLSPFSKFAVLGSIVLCPFRLRQSTKVHFWAPISYLTPVAGSICRPLSQTHIFESDFKNGHISRFCSVFQVIQVMSWAKFSSAEEVDLSFNSDTKEHPQILKPSFWKRDRENVFL